MSLPVSNPNVRFLAVCFGGFLSLVLVGLQPAPAKAAEVTPPAPPIVDTPPPPPAPETLEPDNFKEATPEVLGLARSWVVAKPVAMTVAEPVAVPSGDPYGFTAWLNGVRGQYGLGAVGVDPNLSNWAAMNNGQQEARGMGHHVMGPARRQNSGMGASSTVWQMWMASPAHQAALLDPSISMIGIAAGGAYWTFNAY